MQKFSQETGNKYVRFMPAGIYWMKLNTGCIHLISFDGHDKWNTIKKSKFQFLEGYDHERHNMFDFLQGYQDNNLKLPIFFGPIEPPEEIKV